MLEHKQTLAILNAHSHPLILIASQVSRMATNEPTYEFDVINLRQKRITSFQTAVNAIERQIKKVLQEEESEMHRKIDLFSIGKTNANKTAKADFLDPLDENTFTKKGISNRWRAHKDTDYGKDGMVVVAIITDDVADTLDYDDAEDCALDIEEELQDRFYSDDRLIHENFHEGARVENPADGYPLYITYAFAKRSPQFTRFKHQGIKSNYREKPRIQKPFFPRQGKTYPQRPQYFPQQETKPYWPTQQHWRFSQTYYKRDCGKDSFVIRHPNKCYKCHRCYKCGRPIKCYRYKPYR